MRRHLSIVLAAVIAVGGLAGCGKSNTKLEQLLAAVRKSERTPHRFVYVDERKGNELLEEPAESFRVLGLVEDDFRFKARAEVNGDPSFDEVVVDDLLAIRFLDPSRVGQLLNRSRLEDPKYDKSTDIQGIDVVDALRAQRWVIDPAGAPPITAAVRTEKDLGGDPILDGLTALTYVSQAAKEALQVKEWSEDDLEPAYPKSENSFDPPRKGEKRYDLVRPRLPSISTTAGGAPTAGGNAAFPSTKHFRKMAIYVKDGVIVRVHEDISVQGKALESFVKYLKKFVAQSRNKQAIDTFDEFMDELETRPKSEWSAPLLGFLSIGLQFTGQDPLLVRSMKLDLLDYGDKIEVALPTDGIVRADLSVLRTSAPAQSAQSTPAGGAATGGTGDESGGIELEGGGGGGTEAPGSGGSEAPGSGGSEGGGGDSGGGSPTTVVVGG